MLNVPGRSCPWSTDRQADLLRCGRSPYPYGSRRHAQRANQTWGRPTSGPPGQPLGGGTTHTTATSNVSAPGADAEQVTLPAGQATSCTWPVPTSAKSNSLAFSPLLKFITSVVAGFATCTSLLNAVQSQQGPGGAHGEQGRDPSAHLAAASQAMQSPNQADPPVAPQPTQPAVHPGGTSSHLAIP